MRSVRLQERALDRYLAVVDAAFRQLGPVEVGCLLVADRSEPEVIVDMAIIHNQTVDLGSFRASEDAMHETFSAIPSGRVVRGVGHTHLVNLRGHSITDEYHIEAELLPVIALAHTPLTTRTIDLEGEADDDGWRFAVDGLGRSTLRVSGGAPRARLEVAVSEASAISIVMVGPKFRDRIWAMRQCHCFLPLVGGELVHQKWNEEPEVELVDGDALSAPAFDPDEAVRRWLKVRTRTVYSLPAPTPPSDAEQLERMAGELCALAMGWVDRFAELIQHLFAHKRMRG